jgi:hypothetical protein
MLAFLVPVSWTFGLAHRVLDIHFDFDLSSKELFIILIDIVFVWN